MNVSIRAVLDSIDRRVKKLGWEGVTPQERDVANVDAFYGAVLNGGVDSAFFNSPYLGDMANDLAESLMDIMDLLRAITL